MIPQGAGSSGDPPDRKVVLVVAYLAEHRERLAEWVEEAGFEASMCPGPHGAELCPQVLGQSCPLARDVDAVVIDMALEADQLDEGTPSWVLLDTYLDRGSTVIALADPLAIPGFLDRPAAVLPRSSARGDLQAVLHQLLG